MIICSGDVTSYRALLQGSVEDYLIKLDNYVSGIENEKKQAAAIRQRTKKPR